jgi:hypothetical protein
MIAAAHETETETDRREGYHEMLCDLHDACERNGLVFCGVMMDLIRPKLGALGWPGYEVPAAYRIHKDLEDENRPSAAVRTVTVQRSGVPHMTPPAPASAPLAAPAPLNVSAGKYQIQTGPPPVAKKGRAPSTEAFKTAADLPPGGWFVHSDAAKTFNCKATQKKWSDRAGFAILIYRTEAGKVIVQRPAGDGLKLAQKAS